MRVREHAHISSVHGKTGVPMSMDLVRDYD